MRTIVLIGMAIGILLLGANLAFETRVTAHSGGNGQGDKAQAVPVSARPRFRIESGDETGKANLDGNDQHAFATGIWKAESKDPGKQLAEPMQVRIDCWKLYGEKARCTETSVQFLHRV